MAFDISTEEGQTAFIAKVKEESFDINHPVGYNYTQYPGGKSPSEMGWRGRWELQFENDSCYFITEGENSPEFDSEGEKVEYYVKSQNTNDEVNKTNRRSKRIWLRTA